MLRYTVPTPAAEREDHSVPQDVRFHPGGDPRTVDSSNDSADWIEEADSEVSSEDEVEYIPPREMARRPAGNAVPDLFTTFPRIRDGLRTESSIVQEQTVEKCLPHLSGTERSGRGLSDSNAHGLPPLDRQRHIAYLHDSLKRLPGGFVAADASRPWLLYWALTGLYTLGEDVTQYRDRVISTLRPMQNAGGGFGGGHGQLSHCAASYAAILSLITVGGDEALRLINRKTLWKWLGDLKQPDGGFQVCVGGEEDVRGAYCSMVMISLLNLPLDLPPGSKAKRNPDDTFLTGLPEYLARCQTFEGGISGSPGTEAHGAYAFCALACLCIIGEPQVVINHYLDLPRLVQWLSARQHAPEGGFAGRTNKLVDGCYSHWVGGCWPLVEAALNGVQPSKGTSALTAGSLYSREGLIRYILCCCQSPRGGLRDKPGKHPDSYHSCYILAGLSSAQHYYHFSGSGCTETAGHFPWAFKWAYSTGTLDLEDEEATQVFNDEDRLEVLHPLYVIPWKAAETTSSWFLGRAGF